LFTRHPSLRIIALTASVNRRIDLQNIEHAK
jgi:hypothetical protein